MRRKCASGASSLAAVTSASRDDSAPRTVVSANVFTVEDRERLRDRLIASGRADARISGAALTGSAALDREDRWSDIDLALCVADGADRAAVIADWTERMYGDHAAVDHLDITSGGALYRVFLLHDTLQVDLSFWPAEAFRAIGPSFRLLFGTAAPPARSPAPTAGELAGMGWLYALHARTSIARGLAWQAEHMISGARDQVLALACLRHDLPTAHGRGIDRLPAAVTEPATAAIVQTLDTVELKRAFEAVIDALLVEVELADPELADRLAPPLRLLRT